jgi:putative DNA primase/helicase
MAIETSSSAEQTVNLNAPADEAGSNGHPQPFIFPNPTPQKLVAFNRTDVGNAKRLVAMFGNRLRYIPKRGWLWYDGKRWADVDDIFVTGLAKETLLAMKEEGLRLQRSTDTAEQKEGQNLGGWATASEMGYHLERMVTYARDEVLASIKDFDKDHWLFNAQDCTIDLRTGLTHEHTPKDMITKIAGTSYGEDVAGSRFTRFIDEIFEDEPETAEYVHKLLGLALTGDTSEKHIWFPTGGGDNAKSLLFEITGEAMGEYATVGQKDIIVIPEKAYRGKVFGTANLVGYRRVVFPETEAGDTLNWDVIKPVSGEDTIVVEEKFKKSAPAKMSLKIFIYTNELPRVEAVGMAYWNRIRVIPFKQCFNDLPGCKQADGHLKEKLREELPAILRWLVGGCILWQEYGLKEPKSVSDATKTYQEDNDPLKSWLREETTTLGIHGGNNPKTRHRDLHASYHRWYDGPDWEAPFHDGKAFTTALKAHGYDKRTIHGASWILGIRLLTDEEKKAIANGEDVDEEYIQHQIAKEPDPDDDPDE